MKAKRPRKKVRQQDDYCECTPCKGLGETMSGDKTEKCVFCRGTGQVRKSEA